MVIVGAVPCMRSAAALACTSSPSHSVTACSWPVYSAKSCVLVTGTYHRIAVSTASIAARHSTEQVAIPLAVAYADRDGEHVEQTRACLEWCAHLASSATSELSVCAVVYYVPSQCCQGQHVVFRLVSSQGPSLPTCSWLPLS